MNESTDEINEFENFLIEKNENKAKLKDLRNHINKILIDYTYSDVGITILISKE